MTISPHGVILCHICFLTTQMDRCAAAAHVVMAELVWITSTTSLVYAAMDLLGWTVVLVSNLTFIILDAINCSKKFNTKSYQVFQHTQLYSFPCNFNIIFISFLLIMMA